LDDVVAALGGSSANPSPEPVAAERSLDVLEELASGSIDVNEAERRLKKKK
jgi:hypothetical protein